MNRCERFLLCSQVDRRGVSRPQRKVCFEGRALGPSGAYRWLPRNFFISASKFNRALKFGRRKGLVGYRAPEDPSFNY
jgi:hypothetical protein